MEIYTKVVAGIMRVLIQKSPSNKMLNAAHKLILCGKSQGILREDVRVIGGKQVTATESPGFELYKQIQSWPEWVSTP
ncbi:Peptidoglycan-recognition protein SA [Apis cerana cerana]|uniref:Peptidoglycan-recognition protein SA n=1 Tax=Apis cerana cerana TaxID=94128 RepID=A0A2A3E6P9_APICC|nr:Peptidoglycan-recognition protein SA [Apis cerana cerana]